MEKSVCIHAHLFQGGHDLWYRNHHIETPFTGRVTSWDCSGSIKDGKKVGHWVYRSKDANGKWYESQKGEYNKDGEKEGEWVWYNKDGTLLSKKTY